MLNLKKFVLDILFPVECIGCNKADTWLCEMCLKTVRLELENPFSHTWVVTNYNQPLVQKLIKIYKYNFVQDLAEILGNLIVDYLKKVSIEVYFDIVIPVPLSKKRLKWRSFNQAELLADVVASHYDWPVNIQALVCDQKRHTQVGLKAGNRRQNIEGSFRVLNKETVCGKRILLLDDVATTGATLDECTKMLYAAGAHHIQRLVLARRL